MIFLQNFIIKACELNGFRLTCRTSREPLRFLFSVGIIPSSLPKNTLTVTKFPLKGDIKNININKMLLHKILPRLPKQMTTFYTSSGDFKSFIQPPCMLSRLLNFRASQLNFCFIVPKAIDLQVLLKNLVLYPES